MPTSEIGTHSEVDSGPDLRFLRVSLSRVVNQNVGNVNTPYVPAGQAWGERRDLNPWNPRTTRPLSRHFAGSQTISSTLRGTSLMTMSTPSLVSTRGICHSVWS